MNTRAASGDPLKILVYFLVTFLLGGLLAPVLFTAGKNLVAAGTLDRPGLDWIHSALERSPFSRYFNRAMLVSALLCLYPVIRWMNIRGWKELGLEKNPWRWSDYAAGFLLACGLLLALGGILAWLNFFEAEDEPKWHKLPGIVVSAVSVGFLEEFFFRGAILGLMLRSARTLPALLFTTAFYSVLHFLKPPGDIEVAAGSVEWSTGLWMAGQAFHQFSEPVNVAAGFTTLCAVGWFLGTTRLATRSLWLPIGLHTGWVFGLKFFGRLTDDGPALDNALPWVSDDLRVGIAPLIVIVITGGLAHLWIRLRRDRAAPDPGR